MPTHATDTLIIGAGPYGLALAAQLSDQQIDHLIVGDPMSFWRLNMPGGMYLRSATDWHLDPANVATTDAYLATLGKTADDVMPLSLAFYLEYVAWFLELKAIETINDRVARLDYDGRFTAHLIGGQKIVARRVVIALGFGAFEHVPEDLKNLLPPDSFGHTCEEVNLAQYTDKRVLIVGGRQSAYEWAALLGDNGAREIHLTHRHPQPAFTEADWSWVNPLVDHLAEDPGWYRNLSPAEKQDVIDRMFAEGRLKLEPWLQSRVEIPGTIIHAETTITSARTTDDGATEITLSNGDPFEVDRIILATGYKVNLGKLPLLTRGNLHSRLSMTDGYPNLDESFQTNVPGLYITSMPAIRDFGPFFGFTIAVRTSAKVIGQALSSTSDG